MKASLIAIAALGFFAVPGHSASLCNCCGTATAQPCFDTAAEIGPGVNPLYGISLTGLSLGNASRQQLEDFRKFLEQARQGAEKDRRQALQDARAGKIDQEAAGKLSQRYDDAIVNYFLAMSAYRQASRGN